MAQVKKVSAIYSGRIKKQLIVKDFAENIDHAVLNKMGARQSRNRAEH